MTDLQTVRAALAVDEPDQDVVDRSRHKLQNRMNGGPGPRRRVPWPAIGTSLTAAAVAAAVAIAVIPATPDRPATQTVSGQETLLAAATAAEKAPATTGTYWHVMLIGVDDGSTARFDTWTKADGDTWIRNEKGGDTLRHLGVMHPKPFSPVGLDLTLDELNALPTEPDALTAWLTEALEHSEARNSGGAFEDLPEIQKTARLFSLVSLVSALPAPPAVRGAAFRAIAAIPGVESLGAVPGGQGLKLPNGPRLVVDPATGLVNGTSVYVLDSVLAIVPEPSTVKITAEWTDTLSQ